MRDKRFLLRYIPRMENSVNQSTAHLPHYNVKAVANLVGIAPVTLRAWERRYGLPTPLRGSQGYRLYSDYDVRTLLWLKARTAEGLSISRAAEQLLHLRSTGADPAADEAPIERREGAMLLAGMPAPNLTLHDSHGEPVELASIWGGSNIVICLMRHFGCIFCREWLHKLESCVPALRAANIIPIVVGLGDADHALPVASQLAPGALCLMSQGITAHQIYGIKRGSLLQLAGPSVISSVVRAARSGQMQGETTGDISMLSGVFAIDRTGMVRYSFYGSHAGDHPSPDTFVASVRSAFQATSPA
ncbi:MAG: MerR family transcriptional regulator [Chloroflexi bacterium]|nr:MAG: MerR family transcriptional regulator [Chloroflexota bacterium]